VHLGRLRGIPRLLPILYAVLLLNSAQVVAQDVGIERLPAEARPLLPDYPPARQPSDFVLPPLEELPGVGVSGEVRFILRDVQFIGNTVFDDATLRQLARTNLGRSVSLADLEDLRMRLTRYYNQAGYVTSGAILPDQNIRNGRVVYQILEGSLTHVQVQGTQRLRPEYVSDRLYLGLTQPLNARQLQERFQLLLTDPLIERLNGELGPGAGPGESILDLRVTRSRPYELYLGYDNHRPPSIGSEEAILGGRLHNLTGYGDMLSFETALSEGATDYEVGFFVPLSPADTRFNLRYVQGESSVVEESLQIADIRSDFQTLELGLIHPLWRTLQEGFGLGLTLALRNSQTFMLGRGTPFSVGVEDDGKSSTSVIRFTQDYVTRNQRQVLAARSTFSLGMDAFDATINEGLADGRFFSWIGQIQYARRLGTKGAQVMFRSDLQWANDRLLPLERFALGGASSVRGYRENEFVRDNGFDASVEFRYPLFSGRLAASGQSLQLAVFYDIGSAWNKGESGDTPVISSLGGGLLWDWGVLSVVAYFAHALDEVSEKTEYDLQDDGIHFSLLANIF
jgi:hemolysin activation/secretion protein